MIVILAVTIGAVLFIPFANTVSSNTGTQNVTGETVTADLGNFQDLGGYSVNSATVSVSDASGNSVADTEYKINESAGSIQFDSGTTAVSDGEDVTVDYQFDATNTQTTQVAALLPLLLALLLLVTLASRIMKKM